MMDWVWSHVSPCHSFALDDRPSNHNERSVSRNIRFSKLKYSIILFTPIPRVVVIAGCAVVFCVLLALQVAVGQNFTECQDKPYNYLLPNPDDCKSFYLCRDEVPVAETCSESFWFDPIRLVCALPGPKAFCSELACVGKSELFAEDPITCGQYHYCKDEKITHSGRCESDLVFYPDSQSCTYPTCTELAEQKQVDPVESQIIPFR